MYPYLNIDDTNIITICVGVIVVIFKSDWSLWLSCCQINQFFAKVVKFLVIPMGT